MRSHAERCPKEFAPRKGWDPFFPPGWRQFPALAVSPSLSVALRLAGRWGSRNPIKPALGSLRSSENWQQPGIREFFNSLLRHRQLATGDTPCHRERLRTWESLHRWRQRILRAGRRASKSRLDSFSLRQPAQKSRRREKSPRLPPYP
jgi:hypothetical protein